MFFANPICMRNSKLSKSHKSHPSECGGDNELKINCHSVSPEKLHSFENFKSIYLGEIIKMFGRVFAVGIIVIGHCHRYLRVQRLKILKPNYAEAENSSSWCLNFNPYLPTRRNPISYRFLRQTAIPPSVAWMKIAFKRKTIISL